MSKQGYIISDRASCSAGDMRPNTLAAVTALHTAPATDNATPAGPLGEWETRG